MIKKLQTGKVHTDRRIWLLQQSYLWRGSAVMKVNLYLFINSLLCGRVKLLSHMNVFNDLSGVFESFVPLA